MSDLQQMLENAVALKSQIVKLQKELLLVEDAIKEHVIAHGDCENKYVRVTVANSRKKTDYNALAFDCLACGFISPDDFQRTVGKNTTVRNVETVSYKGVWKDIEKMLPSDSDITPEEYTENGEQIAVFSYNIDV